MKFFHYILQNETTLNFLTMQKLLRYLQ